MNYGEELAYWYLRLNGFFPITNFVIHESDGVEYPSDCDVLAVRLPDVYEEVGGQADDWDVFLLKKIPFDTSVGCICEVKTGRYRLNKIFREEYVNYCVGRLGLVPRDNIGEVTRALSQNAIFTGMGFCIFKLLVANEIKNSDNYLGLQLNHVEKFIDNRISKYPKDKYKDRMFFPSGVFQYMIHKKGKTHLIAQQG